MTNRKQISNSFAFFIGTYNYFVIHLNRGNNVNVLIIIGAAKLAGVTTNVKIYFKILQFIEIEIDVQYIRFVLLSTP